MKTSVKNLISLPALIACISLFLAPCAQAQFQWSQRVASTIDPDDELSIGMALDTNGNCYVTGWFDGTNNFGGVTLTNGSGGGQDIFVAKYNSTGALQWAQQAGGNSANRNAGRGIGVDTNGNVYVAGGYYGPANFGSINLPASSSENFCLAKYNNAGTVQWVQQGAGGDGVEGTGLAVDGAGNSYALVFANNGDTIAFGSTDVNTPDDFDDNYDASTILVKYDNTGTFKWAQVMGGYGETYATKVAVDAAGNVYVRGTFSSTLTIGTSNLVVSAGSTKNMFLAKFNNSGALTWLQQATGGNVDEGGVAVDQTGNVYVSGSFDTNLVFGSGITLTNAGNNNTLFGDAFVAKYNSSGSIQWAQAAGGTNGGFYWDLALDEQGNIYPAGVLGSDAAVAKYNPAGTLQWTYSASGPPASPASSVAAKCAVDSTGNCFLAGWYQGTATFGTNTLQPQGYWNYFLSVTVTNPTVQFTASPIGGTPPLTVHFNSTNVDSLGNAITSWNWNFGDGSTSTLQNPSHTYANVATFYPSFVATNISGVAVIGFGPLITVTNIANPTIQFTASPTNGLPPLAVQFNSAGVDSLGNAITSWNWNFGDGATSTLQNPSHTYTSANIFLPSLTATNSHGVALVGYGPQIATLTPTPSTCFSYITNNGAITITEYICSGPVVNIPSMINGLPVTSIGIGSLQDIVFPNTGVTSVTIPDSVTTIADHAFDSCYSLTNVAISYSVTSIGEWAFSDCQLTSVTIPNSVTSIGEGAFNGCPLTSVTIPNSITTIVDEVFWGCSLTNVSIPNSVTSIGSSAFESCYNLTSITIPSSVTSIGNSAFADCTGLEAVYFPGNAPSADSTVFSGDPGTVFYLGGTIGWYSPFGGIPAIQLNSLFVRYTAMPTNGFFPLTVNFTSPGMDNSNNTIISWNWSFGDGNTSSVQNPSHVYTSAATFQPSLFATNNLGATVYGYGPGITVMVPPIIIQIQSTNDTVMVGSNVAFSVSAVGSGPFSYQWQLNGTNLPNGVISTVAGDGYVGYYGDGGAATNAYLNLPDGVAVDATGNIFIADSENNRIREVGTDGIITTVAGGKYGALGDGGAATNAELYLPSGVAVDASGNLFIADLENNRIRKAGTNGIIITVAGNGTNGYAGDGAAATNAELFFPSSVAVDAAGNLFIADSYNNVIRKLSTNGIINTVAGSGYDAGMGYGGYSGDGGAATNAELSLPSGVAVDSNGNLFIADTDNNRIREVGTDGIITTVAGGGIYGPGDGGAATNAELDLPSGVALDATGNLFIADSENNLIRKVGTNGIITSVAGNGAGAETGYGGYSGDGGPATSAELAIPSGVALDATGNIFIADSENNRIRKVIIQGPTLLLNDVGLGNVGAYDVVVSNQNFSVTSSIVNLAITGGPLQVATTALPNGTNGFTYSQQVLAYLGQPPYNWSLISGSLPSGLTLATNGLISGTPTNSGSFNFTVKVTDALSETATQALAMTIFGPPSVSIQPTNNSVVVTVGSNVTFGVSVAGSGPFIYQWQLKGTNLPNGIINTVAGNGTNGYSGNGGAATNAELYYPSSVAVDPTGNLFIADTDNNRIREVRTNGIIITVAGNGTNGYSGNGGAATNAELYYPSSVAVDSNGNLFITDSENNRIREVGANGIITTVAGNGSYGYSGDGGAATNAELDNSAGVAVDTTGNVFIADSRNQVIREVSTNGIITTVAGNGSYGYSGDGGAATNAELSGPYGVAVDSNGNLFIADTGNDVIREVGTNGIITTVAGNGTESFFGDGGAATNAGLVLPQGVAVDSNGNLFIADFYTSRIRKVAANGIITTVAGNGINGYAGDGSAATNAELWGPYGVAVDTTDNLIIVDRNNCRIREVTYPQGYPLGPTLVLNHVSLGNDGAYDVVVSNPYGSVTSSVVNLTVTISMSPLLLSPAGFNTNGGFQISVNAQTGQAYTLQASTNLVNWVNILNFTYTNSPIYVVDPQAKNYSHRFYRIAQGTLLIPASTIVVGFGLPQPWNANGLALMLQGPVGSNYVIQASTNLVTWVPITNFVSTNSPFYFNDPTATNYSHRFYRAMIP